MGKLAKGSQETWLEVCVKYWWKRQHSMCVLMKNSLVKSIFLTVLLNLIRKKDNGSYILDNAFRAPCVWVEGRHPSEALFVGQLRALQAWCPRIGVVPENPDPVSWEGWRAASTWVVWLVGTTTASREHQPRRDWRRGRWRETLLIVESRTRRPWELSHDHSGTPSTVTKGMSDGGAAVLLRSVPEVDPGQCKELLLSFALSVPVGRCFLTYERDKNVEGDLNKKIALTFITSLVA